MKEEVYSYIVSSIHLLNQSIKTQDERNLKLFSYLYNNYMGLNDQIQLKPNNQDVQLLSYCIINLDNRIKRVINKNKIIDENLVKIDHKIDNIINYINNCQNQNKEVVKKDNKFKIWIKNIYNNIYVWFKKAYDKIYKFLFKKKLQRLEEEKKRKEQEEIEKKRKEKQRIINNILSARK